MILLRFEANHTFQAREHVKCKQHHTFCEFVDDWFASRDDDYCRLTDLASEFDERAWIFEDGECITLAALYATSADASTIIALEHSMPPRLLDGDRLVGRSYRQVAEALSIHIEPHLEFVSPD